MPYRLFTAVLPLLACLACGPGPQFPQTGVATDRSATFPDLIPLNQILAAGPGAPTVTAASNDAFAGRIAQLRRRAVALGGAVIDPATRARMQGAIARAALR